MPQDAPANRRIKSLDRALTILDAIAEHDGIGVTELAEVLDMSKSTVHHHVSTLNHHEYVTQDDGRYYVDVGILTPSGRARSRQEAFVRHRRRVDELANRADETAQLVVKTRNEGIYLYQSTVQHTSIHTHLGTRVGLHSSAAGKAILAQLPDDRVREILDRRDLEPFTRNTITDRDGVLEEVAAVGDQGVAFDDEEQFEGIRCVAGPIGREQEYVAAISITAPIDRMDDDRFRNEIPSLVKFLDTRAVFEKEGM